MSSQDLWLVDVLKQPPVVALCTHSHFNTTLTSHCPGLGLGNKRPLHICIVLFFFLLKIASTDTCEPLESPHSICIYPNNGVLKKKLSKILCSPLCVPGIFEAEVSLSLLSIVQCFAPWIGRWCWWPCGGGGLLLKVIKTPFAYTSIATHFCCLLSMPYYTLSAYIMASHDLYWNLYYVDTLGTKKQFLIREEFYFQRLYKLQIPGAHTGFSTWGWTFSSAYLWG